MPLLSVLRPAGPPPARPHLGDPAAGVLLGCGQQHVGACKGAVLGGHTSSEDPGWRAPVAALAGLHSSPPAAERPCIPSPTHPPARSPCSTSRWCRCCRADAISCGARATSSRWGCMTAGEQGAGSQRQPLLYAAVCSTSTCMHAPQAAKAATHVGGGQHGAHVGRAVQCAALLQPASVNGIPQRAAVAVLQGVRGGQRKSAAAADAVALRRPLWRPGKATKGAQHYDCSAGLPPSGPRR